MIGQAIQATKVNQNVKKAPKSLKNEMLVFGLCSTSDDRPSDQKSTKMHKKPPKSSKNEMLIFGLHPTSDDRPSFPSNESQPKCKKGPPSHQKMKCSFLDYIQLLMIGRAISFFGRKSAKKELSTQSRA